MSRRVLTPTPAKGPLRMRLHIHEVERVWDSMIVGDDDLAPEPGQLKGVAFFGASREETEREAKGYLGCSGR
jgi:hypothetical protein